MIQALDVGSSSKSLFAGGKKFEKRCEALDLKGLKKRTEGLPGGNHNIDANSVDVEVQ